MQFAGAGTRTCPPGPHSARCTSSALFLSVSPTARQARSPSVFLLQEDLGLKLRFGLRPKLSPGGWLLWPSPGRVRVWEEQLGPRGWQ